MAPFRETTARQHSSSFVEGNNGRDQQVSSRPSSFVPPECCDPETIAARMTREPPRTWQHKPGVSTRSTEVNQMRLVVLFMLLAITMSSVPAGATITCPAAEGYPDCHAGE
jgi:hypothetical protein